MSLLAIEKAEIAFQDWVQDLKIWDQDVDFERGQLWAECTRIDDVSFLCDVRRLYLKHLKSAQMEGCKSSLNMSPNTLALLVAVVINDPLYFDCRHVNSAIRFLDGAYTEYLAHRKRERALDIMRAG